MHKLVTTDNVHKFWENKKFEEGGITHLLKLLTRNSYGEKEGKRRKYQNMAIIIEGQEHNQLQHECECRS